jgi:phenylalanyl-tRNA synthetase beta chain
MKVSYNWLKAYVGEKMPSVEKLDELLTFHAFEVDGIDEVGDDYVIDVKVLPDRSSDCLSHRGIAREIASLVPTALVHDPLHTQTPVLSQTHAISVEVEDVHQCRRIALAHMEGVTVGPSPEWLVKRLEAIGQRSINNVVDATNYVMFALGQPLHAYDATKLACEGGVWKLGVRMAREGEEITTLSKEVCQLDPSIQLIVDASHDTPLSIAGVKGGVQAEVDTRTTSLILEAGNFNPQTTRKAAQKLKLPTDAAKRFENNISPEVVMPALQELVALVTEIAGGTCTGMTDAYGEMPVQEKVTVMHAHIEKLLGISVREDVVDDVLARIGCLSEVINGGWVVLPPVERTDLLLPEDIIAEVGRIYGYTRVTAIPPTPVPLTEINAMQYYGEVIRNTLIEHGFSEIITSSFRKKDDVQLRNALAADKGCLRSTLRDAVEEALGKNVQNLDLLGLARVALFEIGTVFEKDADDVVEHFSLAIGARIKQSGYIPKDDGVVTEAVGVLENILGTSLGGVLKNGVYECNLTDIVAKLPAPTAYIHTPPTPAVAFRPYSAYPFVTRDIALWVGEDVSAHDISEMIAREAGELLVSVRLFDEFRKDDRTSYAFRLVFQSFEKTLTDAEILPIMTRIEGVLHGAGFEIR